LATQRKKLKGYADRAAIKIFSRKDQGETCGNLGKPLVSLWHCPTPLKRLENGQNVSFLLYNSPDTIRIL